MANNLTDYLETKLLDHSLGKTAYTKPTTYVVLFTADPGEAGSFANEVGAGLGYARQALTIDAAAAGATQNDALVEFGPASGEWGTITHMGVADGSVIGAGNLLWYGPLATPRSVDAGQAFSFAAGDLRFALD